MKNRVTVTIAGKEYTLIAEGDTAHIQRVASHVDAQLSQVLGEAKVSLTDAAILAGLNIAEEYFKEVDSSDALRRQIKEYLEESSKLKLELSEARRENFKLSNQLQNRRS